MPVHSKLPSLPTVPNNRDGVVPLWCILAAFQPLVQIPTAPPEDYINKRLATPDESRKSDILNNTKMNTAPSCSPTLSEKTLVDEEPIKLTGPDFKETEVVDLLLAFMKKIKTEEEDLEGSPTLSEMSKPARRRRARKTDKTGRNETGVDSMDYPDTPSTDCSTPSVTFDTPATVASDLIFTPEATPRQEDYTPTFSLDGSFAFVEEPPAGLGLQEVAPECLSYTPRPFDNFGEARASNSQVATPTLPLPEESSTEEDEPILCQASSAAWEANPHLPTRAHKKEVENFRGESRVFFNREFASLAYSGAPALSNDPVVFWEERLEDWTFKPIRNLSEDPHISHPPAITLTPPPYNPDDSWLHTEAWVPLQDGMAGDVARLTVAECMVINNTFPHPDCEGCGHDNVDDYRQECRDSAGETAEALAALPHWEQARRGYYGSLWSCTCQCPTLRAVDAESDWWYETYAAMAEDDEEAGVKTGTPNSRVSLPLTPMTPSTPGRLWSDMEDDEELPDLDDWA